MTIWDFSENLQGPALEWFLKLEDLQDWHFIKSQFCSKFQVQLNVIQKLKLRQSLQQNQHESVQEFLERCILAQFAITDDNASSQENDFQRDVLLNFLLGLSPSIQNQVLLSQDKIQLQEFVQIAKSIERDFCGLKSETEEKKPYLDSETLSCHICGRFVSDSKKLDLHILVRHRKNPDTFMCDLCGKTLKSEDSLKKHVQFTCLKDRPVSCEICGKHFIDNKSVKIHIQSVHMKGFTTPTSLKTHKENVHDKLKKYVCKTCGKSFGNQGNLYVHNQRHHERYNYCCDLCGKQFCRPFELRRHMAVKHGEGEMPYPCDLCTKAFFEPKELKSHVAITHRGERPCSCPICPETFTRKSAMRRHIKRKHAEMASIFIQKPKNDTTTAQ